MIQQIINDKIAYNKNQVDFLQQEIAELESQKQKANTTKGIEKWVGNKFESSTGLTEEFSQFVRDFKKHILSVLPSGSELVNWSRGHFEVSGFVKRGDKFVYFSISDVRFWQDSWNEDILIRTAEHEKDYTGGSNDSTSLARFQERVNYYLDDKHRF